MMTNDDLIRYAGSLLYAAMSKCENQSDAEDLVQETLLAALIFQRNGGTIQSPKTWLINTLNHKYFDQLRRKYRKGTISYDQLGIEAAYEELGFNRIVASDELCGLRREIAYLSQTYRQVLARHYMNGENVEEIAKGLGLPIGTVKSRLDSGRKQLRKGIELMETYTRQSYSPETLWVSANGSYGMDGEPRSIVIDDKLAQNLLILGYPEPKTARRLSEEIGVPTAYVEPVIDSLVKNELMQKSGADKVYTDFIVYTKNDSSRFFESEKELVHSCFDKIWPSIDNALKEARECSFYRRLNERQRQKLEFYLVMSILDGPDMYEDILTSEPPYRPNGGRWFAFGWIYSDENDRNPFGKYIYSGRRDSSFDSYFQSKRIELREFDTTVEKLDRYANLKYTMGNDSMAQFLYVIESGLELGDCGLPLMMLENIPSLIQCGVLRSEEGKTKVDIPVLASEELASLDLIIDEACKNLNDQFGASFRGHLEKTKLTIPKHLKNIPKHHLYMCGFLHIDMLIVYEALEQKLIMKDIDSLCPPMILMIDRG